MNAPQRFAAALSEVLERLDWQRLGLHYCSEGGEEFFDEGARSDLLEAEIRVASEIADVLEREARGSVGRSLYVGVAVSELGPMLCEALVMEREVLAFSLDNPETRELNRVLAVVSEQLELALPQIQTADLRTVELAPYDHLWLVSVLNDPEAFPALHDVLYERVGTKLATGKGNLARDEELAVALCGAGFRGLTRPGILTTSDEELPFVRGLAEELGMGMEALGDPSLSPLVEDPVRSWRVTSRK